MIVRLLLSLFVLTACNTQPSSAEPKPLPPGTEWSVATFGGGCFWCLETAFEGMVGVHSVVSGYIDGHIKDPTYKQVSAGISGHAEVVQVTYNPIQVSYGLLLSVFWANIDPFAKDAQFCDQGTQYRSGIYFHTQAQKTQAVHSQDSILATLRSKDPTVSIPPLQVDIKAAETFYIAEAYHQDYYKKNPSHYKRYRNGCGRDRRLIQIWGSSQDGKAMQIQRAGKKK